MLEDSCERPCSELECNIEKCSDDLSSPYVCTFPPNANEFLGCSSDPLTWYNNPNCLFCCDKTMCKQRTCQDNCVYGQCDKGDCICDDDHEGEWCDEYITCSNDNDCKHGKCEKYDENYKYCECDRGWWGANCDVKIPCIDQSDVCKYGKCKDGKCVCYPTHKGEFCDIKIPCKEYCVNGNCVDGQCVCSPTWYGTTCEERVACKNYCNLSHGAKCIDNECVCNTGWKGYDCWDVDPQTCYEACVFLHHDEFDAADGECKDGACTCDVFGGPPVKIDFDCSKEGKNK